MVKSQKIHVEVAQDLLSRDQLLDRSRHMLMDLESLARKKTSQAIKLDSKEVNVSENSDFSKKVKSFRAMK